MMYVVYFFCKQLYTCCFCFLLPTPFFISVPGPVRDLRIEAHGTT